MNNYITIMDFSRNNTHLLYKLYNGVYKAMRRRPVIETKGFVSLRRNILLWFKKRHYTTFVYIYIIHT